MLLKFPICFLSKNQLFDCIMLKFETQLRALIVIENFDKNLRVNDISNFIPDDGFVKFLVYVQFIKAKDIQNPNFFDLNGLKGNYRSCSSPMDVIKYIKMEN